MRSHWTNPTIIRRQTIAALSAAALLVACDQPAGPSRPGGRILADAQAGTVSGHGSGTVAGSSCDLTPTGLGCNEGGKGLKFSFDLSESTAGRSIGDATPVNGTWSASDPSTNVQIQFTGTGAGVIVASTHEISVFGTCNITTPDGMTLPGDCFLDAQDQTSNGAVDFITFTGSAVNGTISGSGQLASGNITID